jgi:hypothetical protein
MYGLRIEPNLAITWHRDKAVLRTTVGYISDVTISKKKDKICFVYRVKIPVELEILDNFYKSVESDQSENETRKCIYFHV